MENKQIKTVALIGLGAMGSFFAPRLLKALGNDFFVIADGERRERLINKGLKMRGEQFFFNVRRPSEGTPADLIIISTKGYSLPQAIEDIKNFVGPDTLILCVLNGVDGEEKVRAAYGDDKVLWSYMRVSIMMRDGESNYDLSVPWKGAPGVHFGEAKNVPGQYSERVLRVQELMERAQIPYFIDEDMLLGIWFKFACNVAENLTCALLGIDFGTLTSDPNANWLREATMKEVEAVARNYGVSFPPEMVAKQLSVLKSIKHTNKPSTLQDLEVGKRTEIDMFAGVAIEKGRQFGVPTPICEVFYHGIKVLEEKGCK